MKFSRQSHLAHLRAALLASSALIAAPAAAQSTWTGPGNDWNTAANWSLGVPAGTATFAGANPANVSISSSATVGAIEVTAPTVYTFSITGGLFLVNGAGVVSAPANAPSFINSANLRFGSTSTAGDATITTNSGGVTFFIGSSTGGNAQFITNSGGLVDFSRTDGPTGLFAITAGSLAGAGDYYLGANQVTVGGNNLSSTVSGVISDCGPTGSECSLAGSTNGSLVKVGTGTLTLSGANTYTGGTTISGGTVVANSVNAGTVDALGTGAVKLDGGALRFGVSGALNNSVTFNANKTSTLSAATGQTVTLTNSVTLGANAVAQFGSTTDTGTLVYAAGASADPTASVVVAGGTLKDSGSSLVGLTFDAASTTVNAGAVLDFDDAFNQAIRNLKGNGSVVTGTVGGTQLDLYVDNNGSSTFGGTISGPGTVMVQTFGVNGTMIFTGANTYIGNTIICACTTLQLGTLAQGSIVGEVDNQGVFNVVNANTSGITRIDNTFGGETHFFNGTSASAIQIVNNGGTTTFHNMSSAGTADINNRNGGETSFLNNATAAGATIDNNGGTTNFLGQSTAANANIDNRSGGTTYFLGQSTAANADIDNRTGGWTIFGDIGGTDTASAGNATITNRVTGGETIFQAMTTAGNATITNNGGATSFFDNSNAGSANINNRNGGQTVFTDNTSAMNATIVNQNGLFFFPSQTVFSGNSTAGSANITNQGFAVTQFVQDTNAGNATIVNNAGGLTTFGTPQFNDAPSAANATITNNSDGTTFFFAFSTAGSATIITNNNGATLFGDAFGGLANATGGNAQFITNAGGIVDFSQTIGPAGDKKITAGSIAGAGDYFLGGVELTVGSNNLSTTVSGTINDGLSPLTCGCGVPDAGASLVKVGTGTLTLSGVNTYTGPTVVNGGTLSVNGSIVSSSGVTVNTGGTLGGTGALPKTTINGGALSPGNSIGTISVNGSLSFVGPGNYIVEVSPSAADKTNVSGAPGNATLAGTLSAIATGGVYVVGTKYTVLNATGGVSGTFSNLAISGSFGVTKPHIEYDANNVYLVLDPNALSLTGLTRNERSVATAVNTAIAAGSQSAPFVALFNLTAAQLPGALDQLSGEVHASTAGVLVDESLYPRSAVLGRLRQASYGGDSSMASLSMGGPQAFTGGEELSALAYGKSPIVTKAPPMTSQPGYDVVFWAQGFGARGRFGTDGNAAAVRRDLAGFFTGADTRVGSDGRLGIAAGYTASRNNLDGRGGANVETGHLMGYGGWRFGALNLRAGGAYAWHSIDTDRTIAFPGFFDRATARYDGATGQIFGEAGYGFAFGKVAVEPFAGAALVHLKTDAFNERGGAAALAVAANAFEVGYSTLGIRAASMIPLAADMILVPRVTVAWQHALTDVTPEARLAFIAAPAPFVVAGVPIARDSLLAEAGLDLAIGRSATLGVSYAGQLARNVQDHAAKGKFSWKF